MSNQEQRYDDDDQSEDEPFNPYQGAGSDDEDAKPEPAVNIRPRAKSAQYDDDEDEEDDGVDEDSKPEASNSNAGNGTSALLGDDEEDAEGEGENLNARDDDDDEEDEEDEEDEVMDRPRKRHKRDRVRNQYIDAEAEVDEDEDEEEEDEEDIADETHPDDVLEGPVGAETDDRRHRELDQRREMQANLDAEQVAQRFQEKYSRESRANITDVSTIPQHLLLPSVNDPTIWAVKCKPGKENELVAEIFRKWELRQRSRDPLKMFSAFARGGSTMTGYIYVEAPTLQDVYNCTDDILGIYAHMKDGSKIIPIGERPDILRTIKPKSLEPGMYVRLKRPARYMGDLALVEDVNTNGLEVTIKIIPRIEYGDEDGGVGKRKRPTSSRPPARLFSEQQARARAPRNLIPQVTGGAKSFIFQNEQYMDGFMIKTVRSTTLQTDNVNPTLEEVQFFAAGGEDGAENLDLTQLAATLKANTIASTFVPGDKVEIYQGEQSGITGEAISVTADIVTLKVSEGPLRGQKLEAPMKGLRKLFREGDHVRVIGGSKYADEAGMIARIKEDRVTLITDATNQEITVFSRDLRAATAGSANRSAMKHNYDLHDLVQLDATTVGCVVKVNRETVQVLDQNEAVRTVLPSQIANKIERRKHTVATDRDGSELRSDDNVKEYSGQNRQGLVLHIHRNFLFVQSSSVTENNGVFVVRSGNVTNLGAKKSNGLDLTKMNPALMRAASGANGGGGGNMAPPRAMGRDQMEMKTVKIKLGPYKGLIGIVKGQAGEDSARVELHSKNKIITLPKSSLIIVDPKTGEPMSMGRGPPGAMGSRVPIGGGQGFPARTPSRVPEFAGSRTPMGAGVGNRTPWGAGASGAGGMTPSANRTPWNNRPAAGGRTPAYMDGSRTAYGGDGSRTSYGGATSYGGSTAYGNSYSGSRTPAGAGSTTSRQPYQAYSAPTPGAGYDGSAATPAAYESAPTPYDMGYDAAPTPGAGMGGPTPRFGYGTPAASAMTPGAYAAETPAAGGDDDGPRYD